MSIELNDGGAHAGDDGGERRSEPRMAVQCGAKVYDPRGHRYYPARTLNVSAGGVLLEVRGNVAGEPGAELAVAIDWTQVHPMLTAADFRPVRIVRRDESADGAFRLALRFAEPQRITHAA